MAGLDSNTSYGSSGGANFNAAYKAVRNAINTQYNQAKKPAPIAATSAPAPRPSWNPPVPQAGGVWQPIAAPQVNWAPGQQPIGNIPYMMPEIDPNHPQYQKPQVWKNMETGEEVTASVPPDYKTYTPTSNLGVAGSAPENLKFRNVPGVGGGQYVVDSQKPGEIIRSDRGLAPWNYNKDEGKAGVYSSSNTAFQHQTMLGNIPSLPSTGKRAGFGMQVDHIVPLALGGADTPQNKELLGPTDNANKTKIQAVAIKLLENKAINENQARIMALTWRDKNPDYVQNTDEYGFVPTLSEAKKIAAQWQKDQETPHPASGKGISGWIGDTWNEVKNLKDLGQETFGDGVTGAAIREFAKGTTSGFTMGYVPYEEDDDYKSAAAKATGAFAGIAGNIVGQFGSFALGMKALGAIGFGLGKIKALSSIFGPGSTPLEARWAAKAMEDALIAGKSVEQGKKAVESSIFLAQTLKNAGVFTLYGQLAKGGIVNSLVTGEDNPYASRFVQDALTAGILGKFNNGGVKNAMKTAGSVFTLDFMMQNLNAMNGYGEVDVRGAIANGLTVGALQYAGTLNSPIMAKGRTQLAADTTKNEWQLAKGTADRISGEIDESVITKAAQAKMDEFLQKIDGKEKEYAKQAYYTGGPEAALRFYQARALALHDQFARQLPADQEALLRAQDAVSLMKWQAENKPVSESLDEVIQPAIDQMIKGGTISSKPEYTYQSPVVPGQYRFTLSGTNNDQAPWLNTNAKNYISALRGENPNKVALTEGYVVFDKQLGDVTKRFSGDPTQTSNYGRVFFPVVDKNTGFTQMLEVGTLPREASLERYNKQNAERLAKNPNSNVKLPDFDTTHNVDNIAAKAQAAATDVVPLKLEYGTAGGGLVGKDVVTENTTSITARIEPDAFTRGKAISDELLKNKSAVNDGNSGFDQTILQQSGAPVDVMNSLVSSFKGAMSQKPEEFAKNVNAMWGPGTMTPDQAAVIIGNPSFSIGDMLALLKKNSPVWKQTNIFDTMIGNTGLIAKTGPAWGSYRKTPIVKFQAIPEQGPTVDLSDRNRPSEATPTASVTKVAPEKPTTAAGNIPIKVKGTYPAFIQARAPIAGEMAKSTEGAIKASENVKAAEKKTRGKKLMQKASTPPAPEEQARIVELKIASKGVDPEVKKALVAEGVPPAMVDKAAAEVVKESKVAKKEPERELPTKAPVTPDRGLLPSVEEVKKLVSEKPATEKPQKSALKESEVNEIQKDLQQRFLDIARYKTLSRAEKYVKSREQLINNIAKALPDIPPPQNAPFRFRKGGLKEYFAIQRQVKGRVAQMIGDESYTKPPESQFSSTDNRIQGIDTSENVAHSKEWWKDKKAFDEKQAKDAAAQLKGSIETMAKKAEEKAAAGEPLGTMDGFSLLMKEVFNKLKGKDERIIDVLKYKFIDAIRRPAIDPENGLPKSQSVDYVKKRIISQRATHREMTKEERAKIFKQVDEERKKMPASMTESEQNSSTKEYNPEDLNGMKIKGARQQDERFDNIDEFEYAFPELMTFLRGSTDNFVDGTFAATNLAKSILKGQKGTRVDITSLRNKLIEMYAKDENPGVKSAIEGQQKYFERADEAETKKIRDFQEGGDKKDGKGGPGIFDSLLNTINPARAVKFDRSTYVPDSATPPSPTPTAIVPPPATPPTTIPPAQKQGFSMPKISMPELPKVSMPKMSMPELPKVPVPSVPAFLGGGSTYDVRGRKVHDKDIEEAAKILYAEISNRNPDKQAFEIRHIINTALNRSLNPGLDNGKSLAEVLQRRAQYQGYAPNGMTVKGGKVVKSQYQLVSEGKLTPDQQRKYEHIKNILNELKNGNFEDTTGGAQFYVHASDGTLWLGKTIQEAKTNANNHEKQVKAKLTKWGTAVGMPAASGRLANK